MTRPKPAKRALCVIVFAATLTLAVSVSAQTYTELLSFNGTNAAGPKTPLVQGLDGSLYGTTYYGGTGTCFDGDGIGCGVFFKLTRKGKFEVLYNFLTTNDTAYPDIGLTLGEDGDFYGVSGNAEGFIFKITPGGTLTTVHIFSGTDGYAPRGGLIQGADGNFYGTTYYGGTPSNFCPSGCGTVFKMTPAGELTTLYSFCQQNYCPDGENPGGVLAQGTDGAFYGTALNGGLYKSGTIFRISANGTFTVLYTCDGNCTDGGLGGLLLGIDGNFYGAGYEYLFEITPQGVLTDLPSLGFGRQINFPIQGSDGDFYGTVAFGGNENIGAAFQQSPDGSAFMLYSFVGYPTDGSYPFTGLAQASDGNFYGTTFAGGSSPCNYYQVPGCGTVFSLNMGLPPFVAFVHGEGKVGHRFGILGQGFTGTTGVSVNGTPATFVVKSDTLLTATVPAGATTGPVAVTTPSGTLTSNVSFYVIP